VTVVELTLIVIRAHGAADKPEGARKAKDTIIAAAITIDF
jgi:hypothetical protein